MPVRMPVQAGSILLAGLLLAAAVQAQDAVPVENPGQASGAGMEQRLARIERVLENRSLLELAQGISSLRDELRILRGQLEEQQHQLQQLQQQQQDIYTDLDKRVQVLSKSGLITADGTLAAPDLQSGAENPDDEIIFQAQSPDAVADSNRNGSSSHTETVPATDPDAPADSNIATAPVPSITELPEPGTISAPAADPLRIAAEYDRAFSQMRSGDYRRALDSFSDWIEHYQEAPQRANALFWKAEILYIQESYADAVAAYKELLQNYPGNRKREQALLKVGYSYDAMDDLTNAISTLDKVVQNFPDSAVSQLAQQRLTEIRSRASNR